MGNRKFIIGIAALIINNQGEILLFKHTYRTDCVWGFPGGYLKSHEDPGEAIQREIYEESGLKIEVMRPLEVIKSQDMARLEVLFLGKLTGGFNFSPSHEVSDARFFPLDGLPELLPEHQALIEEYGVLND